MSTSSLTSSPQSDPLARIDQDWCSLSSGTPVDDCALSAAVEFDNVHTSPNFNGLELRRSEPAIAVSSPGLDEVVVAAWDNRGAMTNRSIHGRSQKDEAFGRNSVSVVAPGEPYQLEIVSDGGSDFVFFVKPSRFDDVLGSALPQGSAYSIHSQGHTSNPVISQAARAYAIEFEKRDKFSVIALETIALQVCVEIARNFAGNAGGVSDTAYEIGDGVDLRVAKDFILANLAEPIGLRDIATTVGMSQYHFSRLFKNAEGQTPYQYVREHRMKKAMDLLAHSDLSLAEIAYDCGFSSQSHLTTAFKGRFGVPPGQWRRLRKGSH